jgi:aldehyde:ferredoxin oxidoreductase
MDYLSSNKIAIMDLANGSVAEEELSDDLVRERIGGAGITSALYERFKEEDPVVLGTGLLTGTLVPGAALGVITAKSPITNKLVHAPFTLYAGMELKFSGFDYLVIKGRSEKPVFLWVHDGIADMEDASGIWGKDTWEATDFIRQKMGDDLIQVLVIGQAGEEGSDGAQIIENYWATGDQFGLGKVLGRKNLKAIALRGLGLLEIADPEGFIGACRELLVQVKNGAWQGKQGIADLAQAAGEDIRDWLSPITHRNKACFNTPYATNTFVFLNDDPKNLKEPEVPEPGFLLTDLLGLLGFKKLGLTAADAAKILTSLAKYGIDAQAAAAYCQKAQWTDVSRIHESLGQIKGSPEGPAPGPFSPWAPRTPLFADFSLPPDGNGTQAWWEKRQALAYLFGIHPLFILMAPELSEEKLLELARIGTGLEITTGDLEQAVTQLTA